jgi:hypothetical protein
MALLENKSNVSVHNSYFQACAGMTSSIWDENLEQFQWEWEFSLLYHFFSVIRVIFSHCIEMQYTSVLTSDRNRCYSMDSNEVGSLCAAQQSKNTCLKVLEAEDWKITVWFQMKISLFWVVLKKLRFAHAKLFLYSFWWLPLFCIWCPSALKIQQSITIYQIGIHSSNEYKLREM